MRICLVAIGTNGDVLPMISLAAGLKQAGHRVRFATVPLYEEKARQAGVEFFPVSGNPQGFFSGYGGADLREMCRRPEKFQRFWNLAFGPYASAHLRDTWEACRGFDTAICVPWFHAAASLSEKLGMPCFATTVMPPLGVSTSAFPCPISEDLDPDGNEARRRSWKGSLRVAAAPFDHVNQWRVEALGLRRQSRMEAIRSYRRSRFLLSYSEQVLPRPADWPETIKVTGFWYMNSQPDWQPEVELADFLDEYPAPILVGFSSQVARNSRNFSEKVVDSIRRAGKSAILLTGWGGLRQSDLPSNVLLRNSIPYDWIVPRVSGFLHHGGCGSMAMCLRHGVPNMAIPFGFDQILWGKRIAALGLGPNPMHPEKIDSRALADSLVRMTEDPQFRENGRKMALKLNQEDAIANAINAIEEAAGAARGVDSSCLRKPLKPELEGTSL